MHDEIELLSGIASRSQEGILAAVCRGKECPDDRADFVFELGTAGSLVVESIRLGQCSLKSQVLTGEHSLEVRGH